MNFKHEGIAPLKKFLLMDQNSSLIKLARLPGILPNNIFSEISKYSIFSKFLISMGMTPMNWLPDKSRLFDENERPITSENMIPLRLLL